MYLRRKQEERIQSKDWRSWTYTNHRYRIWFLKKSTSQANWTFACLESRLGTAQEIQQCELQNGNSRFVGSRAWAWHCLHKNIAGHTHLFHWLPKSMWPTWLQSVMGKVYLVVSSDKKHYFLLHFLDELHPRFIISSCLMTADCPRDLSLSPCSNAVGLHLLGEILCIWVVLCYELICLSGTIWPYCSPAIRIMPKALLNEISLQRVKP